MLTVFAKEGVSFNLSLNSGRYCMGDNVEGTLTVVPTKAPVLFAVSLELMCTQTVRVRKGERKITTQKINRVLPVENRVVETKLTLPTVLFNQCIQGGYKMSGPLPLNFSIPLPATHSPSTLTEEARFMPSGYPEPGYVTYTVNVTATGLNNCVLLRKLFSFNVCALYSVPSPEKPLRCIDSAHFKSPDIPKKNTLTLNCSTDRTMYAPNDAGRLRIWATLARPDPELTLNKLSLLFKRQISSVPLPAQQKHSITKMETLSVLPLQAPAVDSATTIDFVVPSTAVPSFSSQETHHAITISNHVMLRLEYFRGLLSATRVINLEIPIIINGRSEVNPNASLPRMPTPLATLVCQEIFEEKQLLPITSATPTSSAPPQMTFAMGAVEVLPQHLSPSNPNFAPTGDFGDVFAAEAAFVSDATVTVDAVVVGAVEPNY